MSFCDHCAGQRFDRSRVLRALRQVRRELHNAAEPASADEALVAAIEEVRALDIPHFEVLSDAVDGEVLH